MAELKNLKDLNKVNLNDNPLYKQYVCPYCGSTDVIKNYNIKYKSGLINRKMVKCRICNNRMKRETLIVDMSPYDWGLWLSINIHKYRSPHNKFADKVRFSILYENLNLFGRRIKRDFQEGYYFIRNNKINNVDKLLDDLNHKYGISGKKDKKITLDAFIS